MKAVVYDDFLDRLLSTYCTEGLIGLSVRWMQPIQQQGRRIPSLSSVRTLSTCCLLVSGFLTEIVQHIHSLRASGVRSSQTASAAASGARAFCRSSGSSCTTPPEISFEVIVINLFYYYNIIALSRKDYRNYQPPRVAHLPPGHPRLGGGVGGQVLGQLPAPMLIGTIRGQSSRAARKTPRTPASGREQ
jgi:hypothetical protein